MVDGIETVVHCFEPMDNGFGCARSFALDKGAIRIIPCKMLFGPFLFFILDRRAAKDGGLAEWARTKQSV